MKISDNTSVINNLVARKESLRFRSRLLLWRRLGTTAFPSRRLRTAWIGLAIAAASIGAIEAMANEAQPVSSRADGLPSPLPINSVPLGLVPDFAVPADNALSANRVQLGRRLFFDPALSADRSVSCASCHDPGHGFAENRPIAIGVGGALGRRNTPSLLNRAYGKSFFWDGRATSLEQQSLRPIENPIEMAATVPEVLERLNADESYQADFQRAYNDGITAQNLARALASFQRVLLSGDSPVDRFLAGDRSALTTRQRQGLWLFESRAGCWKCHSGANYTDESFHNTGVSWGQQPVDLGRFEATRKEEDRGGFKTPSLRGVANTWPYMHDGSIASLEEVVQFYNRGGGKNPSLSEDIKPLGLSDAQIGQLVDFLSALSGFADPREMPTRLRDNP